MIMNVSEENLRSVPESVGEDCDEEAQFIGSQTGIFTPKYIETGTGSESEAKETRAREDHIKNLPWARWRS